MCKRSYNVAECKTYAARKILTRDVEVLIDIIPTNPLVIRKSLNRFINTELIYNFSPSAKMNFLFRFHF